MTDNKTRWWVEATYAHYSGGAQKIVRLFYGTKVVMRAVSYAGVIGIDSSESLNFRDTNSWWNKGGVPEGVLREFFMLLLDVDLTEDYTSKDYYA